MKQLMKLILLLLLLPTVNFAQQLNGVVVDEKSRELIPGVHVVNKRSLKGTVTNADGHFSINIRKGDTIVFSNVAYQYLYFIYKDSSTTINNVLVELKEQNYLLEEASIFSYKLSSNQPEEIELQDPATPRNEDLREEQIMKAGINNPAEYLYNLFGSKPRQLRELARLKRLEKYRDKLEQSNNRHSVVMLTGLSRKELEAFMFYCKFAPVQMQTLNDYEFLISVQHCFDLYVKERELEEFLQQWD